ncbi:MAG: hypothetical protein NVS3B6_15120 [Pseudarthrobacter sp.]
MTEPPAAPLEVPEPDGAGSEGAPPHPARAPTPNVPSPNARAPRRLKSNDETCSKSDMSCSSRGPAHPPIAVVDSNL